LCRCLPAPPNALLAPGGASPNCPLRLSGHHPALAAAAGGGPLALPCSSRGLLVRNHPDQPEALEALLDQLQGATAGAARQSVPASSSGRRLVLGEALPWPAAQAAGGLPAGQRLGGPIELFGSGRAGAAPQQPYFSCC